MDQAYTWIEFKEGSQESKWKASCLLLALLGPSFLNRKWKLVSVFLNTISILIYVISGFLFVDRIEGANPKSKDRLT